MDVMDLKITAELAKLALTEEETAKLSEEVARMLEYFSSMSEVDVTHLEPTNYVLQKENRTRIDSEKNESDIPDKILGNAPRREDRFIVIPNVL